MKREILFRGKRIDNGEWESGSLVRVRMGCSDERVYIADKMTGYLTPVIPETVCQYTGLKDKNGKNVFVWDILKSNYVSFIVKPTINGWGLFKYDNGRIGRLSSMQYIHKYEVIGTIFDKEGDNG